MACSIRNPEADRLVRELASRTGESITEAVIVSLRERFTREGHTPDPSLVAEITRLAQRNARRSVLDPRSPDAIIGYDDSGLFG